MGIRVSVEIYEALISPVVRDRVWPITVRSGVGYYFPKGYSCGFGTVNTDDLAVIRRERDKVFKRYQSKVLWC